MNIYQIIVDDKIIERNKILFNDAHVIASCTDQLKKHALKKKFPKK